MDTPIYSCPKVAHQASFYLFLTVVLSTKICSIQKDLLFFSISKYNKLLSSLEVNMCQLSPT